MATTFEPLATTTLTSNTANVTFSSISGAYTDLYLVTNNWGVSLDACALQFNGDTGANYAWIIVYGTGSSATSISDFTTGTNIYTGLSGTLASQSQFNIQNYSNTTTFKPVTGNGDAPNGQIRTGIAIWKNTSAITSIKVLRVGGGDFYSGSSFSLYGILKA
jgi:hypothetical protein